MCKDDKEYLDALYSLPKKAREIYENIVNVVCGDLEEEYIYYYFEDYKNDVLQIPAMIEDCQSVPEIIMACALCVSYDTDYYKKFDVGIEAQYSLRIKDHKRIMDFAIISDFGNPIVFVECDGYIYHASTKEQFNYTQCKDREVQGLCFNVLHFTGSDINNDPMKCAKEVWEYVANNYSKSQELIDILIQRGESFEVIKKNGKGIAFIQIDEGEE